jgi:hypothetical protein
MFFGSYTSTFRNSIRNSNTNFKNKEIRNVILNETDPNYGYYFFYREITNQKQLDEIKFS